MEYAPGPSRRRDAVMSMLRTVWIAPEELAKLRVINCTSRASAHDTGVNKPRKSMTASASSESSLAVGAVKSTEA